GARLRREGADLLVRTKSDLRYRFGDAPAAGVGVLPRARTLPIAQVEDACGNHWRFERGDGHLVRIVERGVDGLQGRFIEVQSRHGRIDRLQLHDPATGLTHPLVTYRYVEGDLVAAEDALGVPRTFAYRQHRMVRHTDRLGLSFRYAYDGQWRVVHAWGDGGLYDYRFAYDVLLRETQVTDALGHVSLVKFDEHRLPLCEIDPLDGVTVFEYDAVGRTVAVTDAEGLRTAFAYDARGNLLTLTRPDGSTLSQTFDEDDRLIAVADPGGHAWHQAHDARGLLVEQTDPLGAAAQYVYDAHGQLRAHTNARGATTRLEYDRYGLLAALIDALGQRSAFEHDALGRLHRQVDPLGQATHYDHDSKGRLLRIRSADGGQVQCAYDAEDQLVHYVDEAGAQTRLHYVGIGQIGKRVQPDGHTVEYRYDSEEQLVAVINQRGERYELKRDALGRIVEETDYWGQSRHYQYDACGRLTATIDPLGQRIAYATDQLGRIVRKTLADVRQPGQQLQEHFVYNRRGQLIELRNQYRNATRRFDALGQLLEEVQDGFRVGYGYDAVGNRVLRETSAGNRIAFGYDLRDQVVSVAINDDAPILIERDALGRTTREQLSPQVERQFQYDGRSLLTAQSVLKDAVPLFETQYDYDRAGNLTHRRDSVQGVDEYRYDAIGRLLQHTDPKGRIARFFNDPAGDRLATRVQQVQLRKVVGGDDEHQVQWTREGSYEGVHYVFDRAGDLVRKDSPNGPEPDDLELVWDANHRLAESRKAGQTTHYGYDPLGRRVFKRNPTHTTWFYWDGDALLGEVKQAHDEPDAAPVWVGNVANLIEAKRRKEKLAKLHERVREYVYYPDTFMPFALLVRECRPEASGPEVALTKSNIATRKVAVSKSTLGLDVGVSSLGVLGAVAIPGGEKETSTGIKRVGDDNAGQGSTGKNIRLGSWSLGGEASMSLGNVRQTKEDNSQELIGEAVSNAGREKLSVGESVQASPPVLVSATYYYHVDPNGCPVRLTDGFGRVFWSGIYKAWGGLNGAAADKIENCLRFQGQYFDSETGLHYNAHRYYDCNSGSYIGLDPIRLNGGINLYGYGINPIQWIDPLGLMASLTQINADILRANMAREGRVVSPGQAAGHIVASTGSSGHWAPAVDSRAILARYRIGINDPANGIAVGHPRPHNEMHTGRFHADVRARLQGVVQRMTQQGRGDRAIRRALRRELRSIGRGCRV
ncbi:RHS repeat-associated core domain-containing protein, partial [Xanthomonas euvesicatoria]|nr:RHS repeat-associated core domain-containing protein [Xanthomonas euvesicatoria]